MRPAFTIIGSVLRPLIAAALAIAGGWAARGAGLKPIRPFLEQHRFECHDADLGKGGLDLTTLPYVPTESTNLTAWVNVFDWVARGEMPPAKKKQPDAKELWNFTNSLCSSLIADDRKWVKEHGRATQRRLNRCAYGATSRDLLSLPHPEVRDFMPEDSTARGFNTVGDALDVFHAQMARYLGAADFALRQAMAPHVDQPATTTNRFHAWEPNEFFGAIRLGGPRVRRTFPLLGLALQRDLTEATKPKHPGPRGDHRLAQEAMGVVVNTYEPTEIRFGKFRAPVSGRYRLRFSGHSLWIDPKFSSATAGRRSEPVTIHSDTSPRALRKLGGFDVGPQPTVRELEFWPLAGETIRPDAARLHRNRPPDHRNPFTPPEGMPGVAFQWMEVEGPLIEEWPPAGHRLLFGDLPLEPAPVTTDVGRSKVTAGVKVLSSAPEADAERLLPEFLQRAHRRPPTKEDPERFLGVIRGALSAGHGFTDAMPAGYTAVLCSPGFLFFDEQPGRLSDRALAERLAYFLRKFAPDGQLRAIAAKGGLHRPEILRQGTDRLLNDPRSRQFVDAFLDHWLDLRGIAHTAPDEQPYPDYQLDDLQVESMTEETQRFFAELVHRDQGITNLESSDFTLLDERLATHYGIPGVEGVEVQPVPFPAASVRGGFLTQAAVLKVTANGTTTSPVKRGAWIMTRIGGQPPASVPAVYPDIRDATTIRAQTDKHRSQKACNACRRRRHAAGYRKSPRIHGKGPAHV
jgi:hypothetical protein